jgi:SAM-dependent methyltransferase
MTQDQQQAPVVDAGGNAAQAEAWNGDEGRYWVEHRDRHEAMQRRFTAHLLEAADIPEDGSVLDIGCGCGATTRAAANRAVQGQVLGVDLSGPMLEEARRLAAEEGLKRVRFEQADAQTYPFPGGAFDVVLSRFGVMFFADPQEAFANIARSLRPGGRLAFLCWRSVGENEFLTVPFGAIARHVPLPDLGGPEDPGPFSLADPDRIRQLLGGAGFRAITARPVSEPMWIGADVDDVVTYQLGTPMARSMLASVADEETNQKMVEAVDALREALARHQGPDGIELGGAAWLVTAERE